MLPHRRLTASEWAVVAVVEFVVIGALVALAAYLHG